MEGYELVSGFYRKSKYYVSMYEKKGFEIWITNPELDEIILIENRNLSEKKCFKSLESGF